MSEHNLVFDKPPRDALAMLFLNLHGGGFDPRRSILGSLAVSRRDAGLPVNAFTELEQSCRRSPVPESRYEPGVPLQAVEHTRLREAFERMSCDELEEYAREGKLPAWFPIETDQNERIQ